MSKRPRKQRVTKEYASDALMEWAKETARPYFESNILAMRGEWYTGMAAGRTSIEVTLPHWMCNVCRMPYDPSDLAILEFPITLTDGPRNMRLRLDITVCRGCGAGMPDPSARAVAMQLPEVPKECFDRDIAEIAGVYITGLDLAVGPESDSRWFDSATN